MLSRNRSICSEAAIKCVRSTESRLGLLCVIYRARVRYTVSTDSAIEVTEINGLIGCNLIGDPNTSWCAGPVFQPLAD